MKVYIEKPREIPIAYECDVLVAGGGTTGIIAALAAASCGARTILVERYGFLGGAMIHGATALHSFFNLWKAFPGVEKKQVVRGLPEKLVQAMVAAGGSPGHVEMEMGYNYDSVATCFDPEIFKKVAFDLMAEYGVKLLLHTMVVDTICEGSCVKGVVVESKSGREAIMAKAVVDTTGDGDVAFRAGAQIVEKPDREYPVANTFGVANVDLERLRDYLAAEGMLTQFAKGKKSNGREGIVRIGMNLAKKFPKELEELGIWGPLTVSVNENELTYVNCTNCRSIDAVNRDDMTKAEIALRTQILRTVEFFKKHIPGFENAYLSRTSPQIGVRRTRTIVCEYDMSLEDILEGRGFEDEVARYGFHDMAPQYMIKNGGDYGIPYRAFLPRGVENLLVAGRMITSDYRAHMSTRNTVCCMAQGQAVGTAAAMAALRGVSVRELPVKDLQQRLLQDDVYIVPSN